MDQEGYLYNQFLDLVSVADGKADTIVAPIKEVLHMKKIPTERLYGLATDGAAVMTGQHSGLAKQLKDAFPWMMSVACAAHRLALACKDASAEVPYMDNFKEHLQQLHSYLPKVVTRQKS